MNKLNEKELLEEFEYFTKSTSKHITSDKHSPLNKHGRACEQIKALIEKPGVTKEWYEEKAITALHTLAIYEDHFNFEEQKQKAKNFIHSLVKELRGK